MTNENAMEYNSSGIYCSICNTHDQWCEHIHPPQEQIRHKNLIFSTIWMICSAAMMLWLFLEILK